MSLEGSTSTTAAEGVLSGSSSRVDVQQQAPFASFKWCLRVGITGAMFGLCFGGLATLSPLIKLSLNNENFKQLAPRIMSDFFCVNFALSAASYAYFIERKCENPAVSNGFMPYLGPLTAQIPAMSCLVGSHCFYPGMWAIFNEPSWRQRLRESSRLTVKTLVAFSPAHAPAAVAVGAGVGLVMLPFKFSKRRGHGKSASAAAAR